MKRSGKGVAASIGFGHVARIPWSDDQRSGADQLGKAGEVDVAAGHHRHDFACARAATERRRDAHAAAPSATMCTRSPPCASPRPHRRATRRSRRRRAASAAATSREAPTCRRRRRRTTPSSRRRAAATACQRQASGAAVSGSAAGRTPGLQRAHHDADAGQQAAAAERGDHGIHVRQVLENLEARRGVAGDEVVIVERMHEVAAHARRGVRFHRLPALVVAGRDDGGAEPSMAASWSRAPCP